MDPEVQMDLLQRLPIMQRWTEERQNELYRRTQVCSSLSQLEETWLLSPSFDSEAVQEKLWEMLLSKWPDKV